jgi:type II restriction enzyme
VNCDSSSLGETPANNRAIDFVCPRCRAPFQLKAKHSGLGDTVTDGAYTTMVAAIREDRTPNLLLMRYALATWEVRDLLLIPSFMFSESAIIKRKPLAATARRAGWVGCNIALNRVPAEARIFLVRTTVCEPRNAAVPAAGSSGVPPRERTRSETPRKPAGADACATNTVITLPEEVREKFRRVKPLKDISVTQRGWTLDVLNIVRRLVSDGRAPRDPNFGKMGARITRPSDSFTTSDVYAFTRELERLHPDNRHVRDKIRQQLQVLRDLGLLRHVERGVWRLPL